jgi:hypothetical protein
MVRKMVGGVRKGVGWAGKGRCPPPPHHYSYSTTVFKDFRSITISRIRFNTILIFKNSPSPSSIHRSPLAADPSTVAPPLLHAMGFQKAAPVKGEEKRHRSDATKPKIPYERKEISACFPVTLLPMHLENTVRYSSIIISTTRSPIESSWIVLSTMGIQMPGMLGLL